MDKQRYCRKEKPVTIVLGSEPLQGRQAFRISWAQCEAPVSDAGIVEARMEFMSKMVPNFSDYL